MSIQAQVLNLLEDLRQDLALTYVVIAHDLSVVRRMADSIAVMYLGRIVEIGSADGLFSHPSHPYTQGLISSIPLPDPRKERIRPRVLVQGEVPSALDPPAGCPFHPRCPKFVNDLTEDERRRSWRNGPRSVTVLSATPRPATTPRSSIRCENRGLKDRARHGEA